MVKSEASLRERIEKAGSRPEFQNYLHARKCVLAMLDEARGDSDAPSEYWQEELGGFEYLLDASPLIISRLREHCYHLTGQYAYQYRSHHAFQAGAIERRLRALQQLDTESLVVPESPELGGFGHVIDDELFNVDTLRYYENLLSLDRAGLTDRYRGPDEKGGTVLEIGGGWGGFAYQFKTLYPSAHYIIVDLPLSLLFSITYLSTLFPDASISVYGDDGDQRTLDPTAHDFTFLPHFALNRLNAGSVDLALNMASFQEMTAPQVEGYVGFLASVNCQNIYSYNRDRNPNNPQHKLISEMVEDHYSVQEIKLLHTSHLDLSAPAPAPPVGRSRSLRSLVRRLVGLGPRTEVPRIPEDYRHLVGELTST